MKEKFVFLMRGLLHGTGFALGLGATTVLAVTVSGTMHSFQPRQVLSASAINANFSSLRAAIETAAHVNHSPPVGTILPWHKNLTGVPTLPEGWLECNGQVVADTASVLDGVTLPDLNNQRRFLRGNPTSGALENSQFSQHTHRNNIVMRTGGHPTWIDLGTGTTSLGNYFGGTAALNNAFDAVNANVGFAGTPGETRPINMSVVFIIRIK